MMVLVTYDVKTEKNEGRRRLQKVAKICVNWGQRVQNSVFECLVDNTQFLQLKNELTNIINIEEDSLRFYFLGNNWKTRVEHVGIKGSYDPEGPLIF
ncbi:MAG: CRISPR-associated endonuclease Cas2 [Candidatus Hydrogenedentes bacterium ADurb.Bin179]|nr:MAG: CRISPR-associated endonuclease Cas2 [Candidatus Hydrogenedentes bacterium ADurb.Bin179]